MARDRAGHPPDPLVVRSPSDVVRLVVAVATLALVVLVETLFGGAVLGFVHDLLRGLEAIGEDVLTAIVVAIRVLCVAGLLAGLLVVVWTGRWRVLLTIGLGAAAGGVVFLLVQGWLDEQTEALAELSRGLGPLTSTGFPTAGGLVVAAAAATAGSLWMPRRYRRLAWTMTLALTGCRFVVAPETATALAGLLSGWTGGALAVVALGAPSARPTTAAVMAGLRSVGVSVVDLERAAVDARGSTPYFGQTAEGRGLFVKVLGHDERSADLLFRLYRFLVPRDLGDERPFSSLRRAVEHEALLSVMATGAGVRTPTIVALADAGPGAFVLAYEAIPGRSLDKVDPSDLTDDVLRSIWEQIARLRRRRIAHRDLRLANIFLDPHGRVLLIDFGFAELAASDLLLANDLAEALTSLSLAVGAHRAVASACDEVGPDALRSALPRLRPSLLAGANRTALKGRPGLLTEVRDEAGHAEVEEGVAAG